MTTLIEISLAFNSVLKTFHHNVALDQVQKISKKSLVEILQFIEDTRNQKDTKNLFRIWIVFNCNENLGFPTEKVTGKCALQVTR